MFLLRFDMRTPGSSPARRSELYAAALEMAAWAEQNGCLQLVVSEHHASEDGYLPAPLVLASMMAGRTRRIPIQIAALVLPLHDPIAVAEQMAVLDIASGGRVSYLVAVGYRREEYAMFGRDFKDRGRRMEECLHALRQAWTGETFEFEGRPVRVTPRPTTPGGPGLLMGGRSAVAARRAARFGLGMIAQEGHPEIADVYREECQRLGQTPGLMITPAAGSVTAGFVAEDPDRAWAEIGPYLLHDAKMYAKWQGEKQARKVGQFADTIEDLRAAAGIYRIFTPDEAVEHIRSAGVFISQPLTGGLPPDLAWPSLELLANQVLPRLPGGS
jgi:alkanesulfonate monooxygenase SsuD/methylene tetrahydromethanopterin reductase-like flavin-dependent oxidoreductase (luciferase family)